MRARVIALMAFALSFIVFSETLSAQSDSAVFREEVLDELLSADDENMLEAAGEEFLEKAYSAAAVPNLNSLDYECAVSRLKLTDYQYYQLQLYIEEYGEIYTIYELAAVDGFTGDDIARLSGKVVVRPPPKRRGGIRELLANGRHVFWTRYGQVLEKAVGYDKSRKSHYDGDPAHVAFRYEFAAGERFGIKVAGGKEPGDGFFSGAQKLGFDHYSGSVYLRNTGVVKMAVLGDFRANFGQGLVLGSSLLSGRCGAPEAVRKFDGGLRPVAVTGEGSVLRGGGIAIGNARLRGTLFGGELTNSGYSAAGAALKYSGGRFKAGLQFSVGGVAGKDSSALEKWRAMAHSRIFNASLDYSVTLGRQLLFGELAADGQGNVAVFQSSVFRLGPDVSFGATFRHYSKGYATPLGSPFRANALGCGETGLQLSCGMVLGKRAEATLFSDCYRLHDVSYRTDSPVHGLDMGAAISVKFSRRSSLSATYRFRSRPRNESEDEYLRRVPGLTTHRIRLQWNNTPFDILKLKTECSFVLNRHNGGWRKGVLAYQDVSLGFRRPELSFVTRLAYFDTDSYDERLYAYENDVYYAFNVGSYYYRGVKCYAMVRYKLKNVSFWLRAARTRYFDRNSTGSGLNLIEKPHKTEVKCQVMVRF